MNVILQFVNQTTEQINYQLPSQLVKQKHAPKAEYFIKDSRSGIPSMMIWYACLIESRNREFEYSTEIFLSFRRPRHRLLSY